MLTLAYTLEKEEGKKKKINTKKDSYIIVHNILQYGFLPLTQKIFWQPIPENFCCEWILELEEEK